MSLGKWAVVDIETTGVDPHRDDIIDVGFLLFDGCRLVKTYSSLVQSHSGVSHFIQKLTGITSEMVQKAPPWKETEVVLGELEGCDLLAHNAHFEKSFLKKYCHECFDESSKTKFHDSLLFLGLLFPERSSLSLETFIIDFKIRESESHRGYQDSLDLLKVLLVACSLCLEKPEYQARKEILKKLRLRYQLDEFWFFNLLDSKEKELYDIAESIKFNLKEKTNEVIKKLVDAVRGTGSKGEGHERGFELGFSGKHVKAIWEDKRLKEVFPGYVYRKEQEELSRRVGQSFKNGVHSIIQAPTGTGKTLGYLLPVALFTLNEKSPVLVSTGTKALQHQIMEKDVVQLRKVLDIGEEEIKISLLLGSQNHLCELLYRQKFEEDLLLTMMTFDERYALAFIDMIFEFNAIMDLDLKRGDISYALKRVNNHLAILEKSVAVNFRSCLGKKCPYMGDCSYLKGIIKAREADIIVGNHSLMFHWPKGFPRPQHIIVDEAHKLEKEVSSAFTLELKESEFSHFVKSLDQLHGIGSLFYLFTIEEREDAVDLIKKIREDIRRYAASLGDHIKSYRETCEVYFKSRSRYSSLYWNEAPMLNKSQLQNESALSLYNHIQSFCFIIKELYDLITPYVKFYMDKDLEDENALIACNKLKYFYLVLEQYNQCLQQMIQNDDSSFARSFSYHEEYGFSMSVTPIDVGKIVYDHLLESTESVVYTSATLGNGNIATTGMEWPLGYSYLPPEKRYRSGLFLPPVYDYKNRAKVFLCDDIPPMYEDNFVPYTLKSIMKVIRKLDGRSLLLFSSRLRFEVAREILLREIDHEIPLFIQGMGNSVVEDYRKSPRGVLLGLEAFGEGVDLPGESLQFVFIDKIPDMRQDVVIQQRRDFFERSFGNEFTDYFLAYRTQSLTQKLGRLLRKDDDIGGAIIVDSRIKRWKGRTVDQFFNLMKPYEIKRAPLVEACNQISQFLLP